MSVRAYSRHLGVNHMAVWRRIESGKLSACVVRDAKGKVLGIGDLAVADREWAENSDLTRATQEVRDREAAREMARQLVAPSVVPDESPQTDEPAAMTMSVASTSEKFWKARLAELKFKQESGELVPAADVARGWVDIITNAKTRLLGIPSRAKQALPHLTVTDIAALEGLIREALEGLAEGT